MFKARAKLSLMLLVLCSLNVQAYISPVVIETVFKMGDWQPLPEDKIRSAAVDSALSEISKTKQFAFFTSSQPGIKTGSLKITVHLVEEAETATVSIMLRQVNGISVSSTHSEPLKSQSYDGIYKRFQVAGETAGKKIVKILESKAAPNSNRTIPDKDQRRVNYLENQIININKTILQQTGNGAIRSEATLEYILNELKSIRESYHHLAKKEDIQKQSVKIDKVLNEVVQLNKKIDDKPATQINTRQSYVLENALIGKSTISKDTPAGRDDAKARKLYNEAQELKRAEAYTQAESNLQKAIELNISSSLRSLIYDELIYSLPMFEAQAIAIKLGRNFQSYKESGKDETMLNRISYLYKTALNNNQHDFQRTRQIQALLDQHYNTRNAMSAVISIQNKMNGKMIHRSMHENFIMRGEYPDKKDFEKIINRMGLQYKVISYLASEEKYTAALQTRGGEMIKLTADGMGHVVVE